MMSQDLVNHLKNHAKPEYVAQALRFFKTKEGEYGHGDIFWGLRMPVLRQAVKQFENLALQENVDLLCSQVHELRLFALLLFVKRYQSGTASIKKQIFDTYLSHTEYINNWDLVDCSAHLIIGPQLQFASRDLLYQLAHSPKWWERRIAIMATFHFIKAKDYTDTLQLAELLLQDGHDLIHKAVGWMLREVGNREPHREKKFLLYHYKMMPRTMLRYAIEKFPEEERQQFLGGTLV